MKGKMAGPEGHEGHARPEGPERRATRTGHSTQHDRARCTHAKEGEGDRKDEKGKKKDQKGKKGK